VRTLGTNAKGILSPSSQNQWRGRGVHKNNSSSCVWGLGSVLQNRPQLSCDEGSECICASGCCTRYVPVKPLSGKRPIPPIPERIKQGNQNKIKKIKTKSTGTRHGRNTHHRHRLLPLSETSSTPRHPMWPRPRHAP
jgi:hypothetical protein